MSVESIVIDMARAAKAASREMARCPTSRKNAMLLKLADLIRENAVIIQQENARDVVEAQKSGLSAAMIDRLTITDATIQSMTNGLREVAALEDPVGASIRSFRRPNGLEVSRVRIPLGVIGIIYESRPNVTIDAAALCLKSGNAVILRGGSEAHHSNQVLAALIGRALQEAGLPEGVRPGHSGQRPKRRHHAAATGRMDRSDHSPRRRKPDPVCCRKFQNPGAEALQRRMPCVCGQWGGF